MKHTIVALFVCGRCGYTQQVRVFIDERVHVVHPCVEERAA